MMRCKSATRIEFGVFPDTDLGEWRGAVDHLGIPKSGGICVER